MGSFNLLEGKQKKVTIKLVINLALCLMVLAFLASCSATEQTTAGRFHKHHKVHKDHSYKLPVAGKKS